MIVLSGMGSGTVAAGPLLAAAVFGVLLVLDVVYRRVPNSIVFPVTFVAIAVDLSRGSLDALVGGCVALALFGLLAWSGRRLYGRTVLGMGDVKLAMLVGAILGLLPGLYALALGMVLAGGLALVALLRGMVARQATLPYGAALAAGALIVLAWNVWSI